MAKNDRVQVDAKDVGYGQLAPSQSARTMFTPGKASSKSLDENWPKDFKVPQSGNVMFEQTSGPADMTRVRIVKVGRNIVCDQTLTSVPNSPDDTTQVNDGRKERRAGYDWQKKA